MYKHTLRFLMTLLLAVTVMAGTGGVAQAYLSPSNPEVLNVPTTPVDQAKHMPPSYKNDYTATPDPNYIIGPGSVPDYLTTPNWAYSPPLTKFRDPLPGLCVPTAASGWANCATASVGMNKNIPVAIPDIVTYPGSDYYELELVEFSEQMHSELPPTRLRGYRQVGLATDTSACIDPILTPGGGERVCVQTDNIAFPVNNKAHYLGPVIVSSKDRPVRIKFINKLPIGADGDLFVPVDVTVMGAGEFDVAYDPITKQPIPGSGPGMFAQNRAELHLHGGRTPWISDGTPHQWITPAGENTTYPKGVSVEDVPDMPPGNPGEQTYYWTNQQSSRFMFYHDHAWGITRVNVYVGEAAGYVIRDATEQALVAGGILPADEIPLVIQDKTFVDATTIKNTDPTWAWGTQPWDGTPGAPMTPVTGDLWWPHVYMPAQNPFDPTGIAPMGRWAYGPYFWPATPNEFQPIPNPYYSAACDPADPNTPGSFGGFCQPLEIPSTPNPSWGAEAFMDTPMVNGTAYPVLEVDPKPYRLRILNAAHDRFFNLSMFLAARNTSGTWAENSASASLCNNTASDPTCTEVKMLPAVVQPGFPATWPVDGRPGGVPDFATRGPNWIMIGTEGGFLPQPVVIPPQPVNWNTDPTTFNAGNINTGSLILGPAERADVVVDFSQFAGKTLIIYNDAPAPWPALDPHYDYYTDPLLDNTGMGGAGPTQPGKGPNTRTVMQIRVKSGAGQSFNLAALQNAFNPANPADGVFRQSQDPIIAGQGNMNTASDPALYEAFPFDDTYDGGAYMQDFSAYNKLYGATFPTTFPNWGIAEINDTQISFYNPESASIQTLPMQPKAIQDEQGETFDMFGRMRAGLGLTLSNRVPGQVGFVVQTYSDPSTEILQENGIQVWKITHNGVDTHPIHFHLFDVQVLNRVGWDGFKRLPDPTELGWKDTVRISPLEDTIVALKPVTPRLPFGIPESIRPLNPATSLGSMTELTPIDPATGNVRTLTNPDWNGNEIVTLDWEYVWHCHILSHEENDMMRPVSFQFVEQLPLSPSGLNAVANGAQIDLSWTDRTPGSNPATLGNPANEIGFSIYRSDDGAPFTFLANALANATSYADTTVSMGTPYEYQITAFNAAGSALLSSNVANAQPPQVALTSPVDGAVFTAPADITATASAMASAISVTFYANGNPLGTDNSAPFSITQTGVPAGTYELTAVASDGVNNRTSAPITIEVISFAAPATLTVPATGAGVGTNTLTWTAVGGAVSYRLEQSLDAFATAGTLVYSGPATSATVTVYTSGTYSYRVRAINNNGVTSTWTPGSAAWAVSVPTAAPASLTVPAGSSNGNYTVSWGASPTLGATYVLQESTSLDFTASTDIPVTGLSRVFTGKANGSYYYRVKAVNPPMTDSAWVVGANPCVVASPAGVPTSLTVPTFSINGSYTISWGASPTPAATYTLEESTTADFAAGTVSVVATGVAGTSLLITGQADGVYYYRVTAVAAGYSPSMARYAANGINCSILTTTLTAPLNGASFVQGTPIALTATATTPVGYVIERIDFYTFSTLLGTDTTAPYEYTWLTAPLGAQSVSAVATYTNGAASMSAVVGISVTGSIPVTVDSPLNGSTYDLGSTIPVTASPTIVVGTSIILVEFYDGAVWLGFDTTAPYSYNWTPSVAGAHSLTAMVYYNNGTISSSAAVTVNLNSGAAAPATITVPATSGTGDYTVSWDASTTAGATYTLEESTDNFATYPANASVVTSGLTATSASITGRSSGVTYSYRVKAVKAPMTDSTWTTAGNSCVVTLTAAAPATITVPATSSTGAYTVSWDASTTVGAVYTLEESTDNFTTYPANASVVTSGLTATSASIAGRGTGVTYFYRVKATLTNYLDSAWTTAGNGCAVTLVAVAPATISVPANDVDGAYTVSWGASTTAGVTYVLQEATNATFTTGLRQVYVGPTLSASITGRLNGVTYYYRVRAQKLGYTPSLWSVAGNGCVVTLMVAAPASITVPANDVDGAYTVSWGTSTTAGVTYVLQEATNATFTSGLRQAYAGTGTSANITGRISGVTYYYRVRAQRAGYTTSTYATGGNGCVVTIQVATPVYITVPATDVDGAYTVSWGASTTAGVTYVLQEATNATFTTGLRQVYVGPTLSASITGRLNGVTYYYRVRAQRAGYTPSVWRVAGNGCVVTLTVAAPASITVPTADVDGVYTVSWGASTTAGVTYVLQEATNATFTSGLRQAYAGTALSASITGRSAGVTYYYRVRAQKVGYITSAYATAGNGCLVGP